MKADHEIERAWQLWEKLVDLENFLLDVYHEDFVVLEKQNQPGTDTTRLTLQRNLISTKADNLLLSVRQVCPVISVLDPLNKPKRFFTIKIPHG